MAVTPGVHGRRVPETSGPLPSANLANWTPPSVSTNFGSLLETSLRLYMETVAVHPAFGLTSGTVPASLGRRGVRQ